MASSAQNHPHHFPPATGTTTAPPPTPSTAHPNFTSTANSAATDLLSRLLHRLPPTLSDTPIFLRRRSTLAGTASPPVIPFSDLNPGISSALPSVSELGYFELTNHSIPSQLAHSAESDSLALFNLSGERKHENFPRIWPLGFDDDEEDGAGAGESLFLDSDCSTESSELTLSSLREFTRESEKIGLAVVEALTFAMGLDNPARDDAGRVCSLMWVSNGSGSTGDGMVGSGKFYPYVVGLHYQIRSQKCSLLADSGLVSVACQMDSILVTLGDIAQVWSNGKLKKVRGKPMPNVEEGNTTSSISMSLLVTLPLESTVSPLSLKPVIGSNHYDDEDEKDDGEIIEDIVFNSFSFEDFAWRVYHERVPLKDPLDRYRM